MRSNDDISIALCTYNGEAYLEELLNSLLNQTYRPKELVVCDDGSVDETLTIIERFSSRAPFLVRIIKNDQRVGPSCNFSHAIMSCNSPYIALCDQDDVWKENKLELTLHKMKEIEAMEPYGCPILIHGDLIVTNESLQPITYSMMDNQGYKNEDNMQDAQKVLVVQNYVTGCTVMINRHLRDIACPIPKDAVMHDWWLALIAASKGKIGFVEKPLIYYRQHGSNTVGAVMNKWQRYTMKILHPNYGRNHLKAIILQDNAAQDCLIAQQFIDSIINCSLLKIFQLGIHRQNLIGNLGLFLSIFCHKKYYREILLEFMEKR